MDKEVKFSVQLELKINQLEVPMGRAPNSLERVQAGPPKLIDATAYTTVRDGGLAESLESALDGLKQFIAVLKGPQETEREELKN